MAHELSERADGFVEMAYVGEKPWHGLGQELDQTATLDTWKTSAGMDWRVQRSKVRFATSAMDATLNAYETDDSKHVLFRSDTKAPLGIVGEGFKVVQPAEALEFFRDLTESAGYHLCTAGTLKGGRKFWAQAERSLSDNVIGNDVIKARLLLATACDGSMLTIVREVSERVVCANTLAIATAERGGKQVKVSHRSVFDAESVKAQLSLTQYAFEKFICQARMLACETVSPQELDAFLLTLLFDGNADAIEAKGGANGEKALLDARAHPGYVKIMDLFNGAGKGSAMPGVRGTAWGVVNAVTEYVDHHRGTSKTTRDNRMDYSWFGPGDTLKTDAFNAALALVA